MAPPSPENAIAIKSVLIAIADPILQLGFQRLLEEADDCRPVGGVSHVGDVREAVARIRPDVLLLDVAMRARTSCWFPSSAGPIPKRGLSSS